MAHFYGQLKGSRGTATRAGTKRSGYHVEACSWQGKVVTTLYHDPATGLDMARVFLSPHLGAGTHRELYNGPVQGFYQ